MATPPIVIPDSFKGYSPSDPSFRDYVPLDQKRYIDHVLLRPEDLLKRMGAMAKDISDDYRGRSPQFLCVLEGARYFNDALWRALRPLIPADNRTTPIYVGAKSTDHNQLTGAVNIGDIPDLRGRHVIIVEDIIDSCTTMPALVSKVKEQHPSSLSIAALLYKRNPDAKAHVDAEYVGFSIPCRWVFGMGMDLSNDPNTRKLQLVAVANELGMHLPDLSKEESSQK